MNVWVRRLRVLLYTLAGLVLIASAAPRWRDVRVVYNVSDSVPRGWYRITELDEFDVGDIVLVALPQEAALLAGERGYLPVGVPLLKRIGAVSPQLVCIRRGFVEVEGAVVAAVRKRDAEERLLPYWPECRVLAQDEVFLLSATHSGSFDSRYFGPVDVGSVVGRAHPLWVWEVR